MPAKYCLECGAALSDRATGGLCAACALRGALASPDDDVPDGSTWGLAKPAVRPSLSIAGQRFGDYELLEEIGHGGMGVVYRARQISLGRLVAVKVIRAERLARAEDVRRFRMEAAAAAQLQHPNIVAVHEAGEVAGQHFYSMDYVDGPSLAERVRAHPASPLEAAGLVKTLSEAIHHAHEHGILHRDLKPSNTLIGGNGRARVADFGLAKVLRDEPGVTRTGEVMGSPSYMAPEQAGGRNREVDARTDVYALGAILYELLVGRPPFRAATSIETLRLLLETVAVSPRVLNPRLPRDLETICLKCLEKNPGRRCATAKDLADDLGRFLDLDLPEEAETIYRDVAARSGYARVMAETIPLLAGDGARTAANSLQFLEAMPAQHPARPTFCYLAGKGSPEELVDTAGARSLHSSTNACATESCS